MANAVNTYTELELLDGTKVPMTLNYARMLKLSRDDDFKDVYARFSVVRMEGLKDELDIPLTLYVGYLCANIECLDKVMTEYEFYEAMDPNRAVTQKAWKGLVYPKKAPAFKNHS